MAEMIEARFRELEAILQARLSIPAAERPSTCHEIPVSVSSELCLKTTANPKLDLSQTAKVLQK